MKAVLLLVFALCALAFVTWMFLPESKALEARTAYYRATNNPAQICLDTNRQYVSDPKSAHVVSYELDEAKARVVVRVSSLDALGAVTNLTINCVTAAGSVGKGSAEAEADADHDRAL